MYSGVDATLSASVSVTNAIALSPDLWTYSEILVRAPVAVPAVWTVNSVSNSSALVVAPATLVGPANSTANVRIRVYGVQLTTGANAPAYVNVSSPAGAPVAASLNYGAQFYVFRACLRVRARSLGVSCLLTVGLVSPVPGCTEPCGTFQYAPPVCPAVGEYVYLTGSFTYVAGVLSRTPPPCCLTAHDS